MTTETTTNETNTTGQQRRSTRIRRERFPSVAVPRAEDHDPELVQIFKLQSPPVVVLPKESEETKAAAAAAALEDDEDEAEEQEETAKPAPMGSLAPVEQMIVFGAACAAVCTCALFGLFATTRSWIDAAAALATGFWLMGMVYALRKK